MIRVVGQFSGGKSLSPWRRALRLIRLAFDTWYPWDKNRIPKKLQPLRLRVAEASDLEWCEKLYQSVDVPDSGFQSYQKFLTSSDRLLLIAEDDSGRIATFGLSWVAETVAWLCYILVEPARQKQGIGTTLVVSAISLLRQGGPDQTLCLLSLGSSVLFYRKIGFVAAEIYQDNGLELTSLGLGPISPLLVMDCARILKQAGVEVTVLGSSIPPQESSPVIGEAVA